jgi:general secretion pathway protein K
VQTNVLKSQQGMALIVVLMMVAIIASMSAQIASSTGFAITRTTNEQGRSQAYWYGIGMESLAVNLMQGYMGQSKRVHLDQPWALTMTVPYTKELDDGVVGSVQVVDLSSRFNLNSLRRLPAKVKGTQASQTSKQQQIPEKNYQGLLSALNLDKGQISELSDALIDYIDSDQKPQTNGSEDSVYLNKPVPYRTPGNYIQSASELRAVEGYTQHIVQGLRSFLVALPSSSCKINVNTITKEGWPVLSAALQSALNRQEVLELIEARPIRGWENFDQLKAAAVGINSQARSKINNDVKKCVSFNSQYFLLHLEITFPDDQRKFIMESVLENRDQKIKVVNRYLGRGV